jgi:LEA14-like dessication related protein
MREPTLHHRKSPAPGLHLALALVLAAATSGCASMTSHEPLDVTLVNLHMTEVTVFETTLTATLRITNPNPEPFVFEGASFKLYLENKKVGTGTAPEGFTVDRLDSSVVDATVHINNASAILRLKEIISNDRIAYGVRGSLFTQGSFGSKRIKFDSEGTIELDAMLDTPTDELGTIEALPDLD